MPLTRRPSVIQIVLVDGNGPARERLVDVCTQAPDLELLGPLATALKATDQIRCLQPAVAVLDAALWSSNLICGIGDLAAAAPATRLVVLVPDTASSLVCPLIHAGATSVVLRGTASETLLQIIRAAARGEGFVPRELVGPDPPHPALPTSLVLPADALFALTAREREILRLLMQGYSTRAIADRLRISEEAVKTYWKRIKRKAPTVAQRVTSTSDARPV